MCHVKLSPKNCRSDYEALMGEEDGSMGKNSIRGKMGIGCKLVMAFKILFYISIFAGEVYVITGLGPSDSTIYIQDVYIPALALDTNTNTNTNTTTGINGTTPFNASIFVDLKFQRTAARSFNVFTKDYAESGLDVFYSHSLTPAANYRFRAFHMGRNMMVHEMAAAMEAPELPWEEARRAVSGGSTVELVVEFGGVRLMQRREGDYFLSAHVAVDGSGHMVSKGPVKLKRSRGRRNGLIS